MFKGMDGIVLGCFYSITGLIIEGEQKKYSILKYLNAFKCKYLPRNCCSGAMEKSQRYFSDLLDFMVASEEIEILVLLGFLGFLIPL